MEQKSIEIRKVVVSEILKERKNGSEVLQKLEKVQTLSYNFKISSLIK